MIRSSPLYLLHPPALLPRLPTVSSSSCSAFCGVRFATLPWIRKSRDARAATCGIHHISTEADSASDLLLNKSPNKPFIVTTPLYYVNAAPHMGSAYPTIAADAISRFQRLQGKGVIFITGTDEHGEKIALAAAANGRAPKEHCDIIAQDYKSLWKDLDINYDRFVRTTNIRHEKIVEEFYRRVLDKGDIFRADYEGLYCINCEEFKEEKDLVEDKCCPIHRKPCEFRKEDNFFFALSKYQQRLEALLSSNSKFVQPTFRFNEVAGWVKEGLRDFSISRAAVDWGIPVPTDSRQTIYVWFDALLGYISALLPEDLEPTLENAINAGWPASVHIIGKDILRFHAVYWPGMLMSAGLPLPGVIFGHGFLTKDGLKMGKSLGNTVEPKELVKKFGSDAVRYYFLKEIEFGSDGDYSEHRFINIVNAHLANTVGNLLHRTLGLLKKNCESRICMNSSAIADDNVVRITASSAIERAKEEFLSLRFSSACETIISIATAGNVHLDERAPWSLFKKGGETANEAAKDDTRWGGLKDGQVMPEPQPVFKKIELEVDGMEALAASPQLKKKKKAKEVLKSAAS